MIWQARKERLERVENDTFCSNRVDGVPEPNEQAVKVVFAGFLDLAAFDTDVIELHLCFSYKLVEVETQGTDIFS